LAQWFGRAGCQHSIWPLTSMEVRTATPSEAAAIHRIRTLEILLAIGMPVVFGIGVWLGLYVERHIGLLLMAGYRGACLGWRGQSDARAAAITSDAR
jgi:hypothetical protein